MSLLPEICFVYIEIPITFLYHIYNNKHRSTFHDAECVTFVELYAYLNSHINN